MADVEIYPPQYHQYLATQRRVSNWVKHTHSQTQLPSKIPRPSSKRSPSAESTLTTHTNLTRGRGPRKAGRKSSTRIRHSTEVIEQPPVSPAVALVSSSLFVCALLPSILTVTAFVVLLTLASMEKTDQNDKGLKVVTDEE